MARNDAKSTAAQPRRATPARRVVQLLIVVIVGVAAVDGLVGDRGFMAMLKARRQYEDLSRALEHQKAENARLREEARRLNDDPTAIEELARRNLGLIRPGERVFIVKDLASPVRR